MENFREKDYKIFELFDRNWAVVTAGTQENFNACTVSWGSLGNIWGSPGKSKAIATVYIHPARYTSEFLKNNDTFTVSFFPKDYKKALLHIGTHSGRDGDKIKVAGITPKKIGDDITYEEANLTFVCKKLYAHQLSKEDLHEDIQKYYGSLPEVYPDFKGGWQPHIVIVGEIIKVEDNR